MRKNDYYCENCFKEHLDTYYEDVFGKIFCNKKCYKESLEFRDIEDETLEED